MIAFVSHFRRGLVEAPTSASNEQGTYVVAEDFVSDVHLYESVTVLDQL